MKSVNTLFFLCMFFFSFSQEAELKYLFLKDTTVEELQLECSLQDCAVFFENHMHFNNLKRLSLSNLNQHRLEDFDLKYLNNITSLSIEGNMRVNKRATQIILNKISSLTNLEHLSLSGFHNLVITSEIQKLKKLKSLILIGNIESQNLLKQLNGLNLNLLELIQEEYFSIGRLYNQDDLFDVSGINLSIKHLKFSQINITNRLLDPEKTNQNNIQIDTLTYLESNLDSAVLDQILTYIKPLNLRLGDEQRLTHELYQYLAKNNDSTNTKFHEIDSKKNSNISRLMNEKKFGYLKSIKLDIDYVKAFSEAYLHYKNLSKTSSNLIDTTSFDQRWKDQRYFGTSLRRSLSTLRKEEANIKFKLVNKKNSSTLIYLDDLANQENKTESNHRAHIIKHYPELKYLSDFNWLTKNDSIASFICSNPWTDIRISLASDQTCTFNLKDQHTIYSFELVASPKNGVSKSIELKKQYDKYARSLKEKVNRFKTSNTLEKKDYITSSKTIIKDNFEQIRSYFTEDEKLFSKDEWLEYRDQVLAHESKAIKHIKPSHASIKRALVLNDYTFLDVFDWFNTYPQQTNSEHRNPFLLIRNPHDTTIKVKGVFIVNPKKKHFSYFNLFSAYSHFVKPIYNEITGQIITYTNNECQTDEWSKVYHPSFFPNISQSEEVFLIFKYLNDKFATYKLQIQELNTNEYILFEESKFIQESKSIDNDAVIVEDLSGQTLIISPQIIPDEFGDIQMIISRIE